MIEAARHDVVRLQAQGDMRIDPDDTCSPRVLRQWLLADEPCPREQFYELKRERAQIDAHRPGKLAFVNLLPNYGFPRATLGWDSYEEYLDFFIVEYKPQVLCFDHYPWFEGESPARIASAPAIHFSRAGR